MNLFVIYVGGKTETSLIEVHDIHFALGEKIEDTYDQIRNQWWGIPIIPLHLILFVNMYLLGSRLLKQRLMRKQCIFRQSIN